MEIVGLAGATGEEGSTRTSGAVAQDYDAQLQCVIDLSCDYYWEQDSNARFTLVRPGNPQRPDTDATPLVGRTFSELGLEPTAGTWDDHRVVRDARLPFVDLIVARGRRGRTQYLTLSGVPTFDAEGRFSGYRGTVSDVTPLKRAERLLQLERQITHLLVDAGDTKAALADAVRAICESEQWEAGLYWHLDETGEVLQAHTGWVAPNRHDHDVVQRAMTSPRQHGEGLVGEVFRTGTPVWIPDVRGDARVRQSEVASMTGWTSAFYCPVLLRDTTIGVLEFNARHIAEPDPGLLQVIRALGTQIGHFYERATTAARLRESEERYATTVELAAIGIAHVGLDGRFLHVNPVLCRMLGYTKEELVTLTVRQISHPDDVSATDGNVGQLNAGSIESFTAEKRYLRKDGTPIWVRLTVAAKRRPNGAVLHHVSIVEDISDRHQAEARVQYLATHDEMTGLMNRTMFNQLLTHAIEQARRHKQRLAVLFIDLDRFKMVNDSLGHEAGDDLLKTMAARIQGALRVSDIVARLGGDEFVVLVEAVPDRQAVEIVARNLLTAVLKPIDLSGQECRVTASIGIAVFPDDATDTRSLMKHADLAMYQAKEEGKNTFEFFSSDASALSVERLVLETHLRKALELQQFSLHYQPKVSVKTGQIAGAEALLRWHSPELGAVPPSRLIPVAEESGLMVPIGRWTIRTACKQSADWLRQGLPPVCVAVNLSPRQFLDPSLVSHILGALEDAGLPPELLELEIAEGMLIRNAEHVVPILGKIKGLGVRIAIDDFGTGYASLSQLKRIPIDTLKVDRSFIRDLSSDAEDGAIASAIISLGKSLGVTVVAEGVETRQQQDFLSRRSCDQMQGFYFSRPSNAEEFATLLRRHAPASPAQGSDEAPGAVV